MHADSWEGAIRLAFGEKSRCERARQTEIMVQCANRSAERGETWTPLTALLSRELQCKRGDSHMKGDERNNKQSSGGKFTYYYLPTNNTQ